MTSFFHHNMMIKSLKQFKCSTVLSTLPMIINESSTSILKIQSYSYTSLNTNQKVINNPLPKISSYNNHIKTQYQQLSSLISPALLNKSFLKNNVIHKSISNIHSSSIKSSSSDEPKVGLFTRMIMMGNKNVQKQRLTESGTQHYINIASDTDVLHFFKLLSLPDTFFSWFIVMELQVWLLMARLGQEGEQGKMVRDSLITSLWLDVDHKIKNIGRETTKKRHNLELLLSHFQMSLISYDEGLLGNDKELAGSVWRNIIRREIIQEEDDDEVESDNNDVDYSEEDLDFILAQTNADPRCIEAMVHYIRKQIQQLDEISSNDILWNSKAVWNQPEILPDEQ